jgi:hypothetical protein
VAHVREREGEAPAEPPSTHRLRNGSAGASPSHRIRFRMAGISVLNIWGGTAGNWGRRSLDLDEMEIMIVACKTGEPLHGG